MERTLYEQSIFKQIQELIEKARTEEKEVDEIELTGTGITFYDLDSMLKEMGYEYIELETVDYDIRFWYTYEKAGMPRVIISGRVGDFSLFIDAYTPEEIDL